MSCQVKYSAGFGKYDQFSIINKVLHSDCAELEWITHYPLCVIIIKSSILFLKVCLGEKKQKNWLESMSKLMGHKIIV